ncbi:hypothetical protein PPERSA_12926 [Pseudocohnilembus persalinus]|uniref:Uncharacterized protein n=1 Tax=Pseudocohnilembus persalinus TaxID=266149 RepID=A0A0V0R242_PSEPJ|nr:hypothetical protein PPERSA_12926 [Pseudocohnilembus persalinus]|eukprot:KRX08445.1 hypothetical protein PPERSA_12926 [Pseudocohnilembus persalinus]
MSTEFYSKYKMLFEEDYNAVNTHKNYKQIIYANYCLKNNNQQNNIQDSKLNDYETLYKGNNQELNSKKIFEDPFDNPRFQNLLNNIENNKKNYNKSPINNNKEEQFNKNYRQPQQNSRDLYKDFKKQENNYNNQYNFNDKPSSQQSNRSNNYFQKQAQKNLLVPQYNQQLIQQQNEQNLGNKNYKAQQNDAYNLLYNQPNFEKKSAISNLSPNLQNQSESNYKASQVKDSYQYNQNYKNNQNYPDKTQLQQQNNRTPQRNQQQKANINIFEQNYNPFTDKKYNDSYQKVNQNKQIQTNLKDNKLQQQIIEDIQQTRKKLENFYINNSNIPSKKFTNSYKDQIEKRVYQQLNKQRKQKLAQLLKNQGLTIK